MTAVAQQISGQYRKLNFIIISNCCTLIDPKLLFKVLFSRQSAIAALMRLQMAEVYKRILRTVLINHASFLYK